ncbi:hypothetical protein EGW08_000565 [Elysia chlorotica]|uniref:Uncharacterized protein n=1 Tax=Elysia chlorotica TaxID=188477 RepID=A0A433UD70_ELYCH|nr:hypothetical protein EGW08_000565 [Elysia chlorotica]
MDLNSLNARFKKVAGGASTVFNRAVQFTEEKLGTAEKTELDAHFENLMQRSDKTKLWTETILRHTASLLQPNPNQRMEDLLYEKLDRKKKDRITQYEIIGNAMVDAGNEFGPGTSYGNALVKCGQAQLQIGNAERDFITSTANNFLQPLSNFLEGDMKTILKEKKILETKRLDLDACKSRLRKAKSATSQSQAFCVPQTHHLRCLNDFIEAQMTFYAQCQQYMADLQRQLGSFPVGSGGGGGAGGSLSASNNNLASTSSSGGPLAPSAPPSIEVTAATPVEKRQAKALYDYDAADSSELSLLADELIMVYKAPGLDPDWLMAERGSQRGKVPVTYLKVLE